MKTTLHYSTFVTLSVYTLGMKANLDMGCKPLSEIVDYAEHIFNDDTMFHGENVEQIVAFDSKTGELIAEFTNDDWNDNENMNF